MQAKSEPKPESAVARARRFLRDELSGGPVPANEITRRAEKAGITAPAIKEARADLGVRAEKQGFGAQGNWLLALAVGAGVSGGGDPSAGWLLLAGAGGALVLAYACIHGNYTARAEGGCGAPAITTGFPAPGGVERKDCCPEWTIVALILLALILTVLGLVKL